MTNDFLKSILKSAWTSVLICVTLWMCEFNAIQNTRDLFFTKNKTLTQQVLEHSCTKHSLTVTVMFE